MMSSDQEARNRFADSEKDIAHCVSIFACPSRMLGAVLTAQ